MGEEAAVARGTLTDGQVIGAHNVAATAEALAFRHRLPASAALEELLEKLIGLSCRDQEERAFDPQRMAERRRNGFALAKSMRKEAAAMLRSLERLHRAWCEFEAEVEFNPKLLEAIFNIDTGGPGNLFLPPEISILQSLFRTSFDDGLDELREEPAGALELHSLTEHDPCPTGFWEAADRRLQAVVDMPIRTKLSRGPMPNIVIRDALVACRSYWVDAGRRWSMGGLKTAAVRQENVRDYLTGACARFVVDALTTADINFNLSELHSAWETTEGALRRRAPHARLD